MNQWYSAPDPGEGRVPAWAWVLIAVVLVSGLVTATFTLGSIARDSNPPATEYTTGP